MFKLLDGYILRKFIGTFVFTMLVITVIAVVIDTSEKADDFVRSGLTFWQLITHYFIGFIPFIMSMIFPLMVFIAVIYFSSKMAGRSEFIAILAGGVRYNRMLRPYLIGGVFLSVIFWLVSIGYREPMRSGQIFRWSTSTATAHTMGIRQETRAAIICG